MRQLFAFSFLGVSLIFMAPAVCNAETLISDATQECLDCHATYHPGIVADWQKSRHAAITPGEALQVKGLALKVSAKQVPQELSGNCVGCAECHTMRAQAHADTFEHNGYQIHIAVSPDDCAVCHKEEREQFGHNIMSMAEKNLAGNTLYQDMQRTILGTSDSRQGRIVFSPENDLTRADACYYCHGTRLKISGMQTRQTDVGELEFPVIAGWPNQGVGRVNLDGSRGACSACHTRHQFSMEMARKPHTCKECHVGPDVPAYKVYSASKHGNIYSALKDHWDFKKNPWTIGQDFTAPTCAVCHISLTVTSDGEVVNPRTHQMSDRLGWRIFGLIYAHPQPKSPDTTIIRNSTGLPLPTDLDGTPSKNHLISADEINTRRRTMQNVCMNCHGSAWVQGYFKRLDNTIASANATVLSATRLIQNIWEKGYARGPAAGGSLFDEFIERRWSDVWLLYTNNTRFVSAMAGGGDYGVFEDGRYHSSGTILELQDWIHGRDILSKNTK